MLRTSWCRTAVPLPICDHVSRYVTSPGADESTSDDVAWPQVAHERNMVGRSAAGCSAAGSDTPHRPALLELSLALGLLALLRVWTQHLVQSIPQILPLLLLLLVLMFLLLLVRPHELWTSSFPSLLPPASLPGCVVGVEQVAFISPRVLLIKVSRHGRSRRVDLPNLPQPKVQGA